VFVRYLQQGFAEREARHKALSEVKEYLSIGGSSAVRLLSAGNGQSRQGANEQADASTSTVKGRVRSFLEANPDVAQQSVNQVLSTLHNAGIQSGRTTMSEVLREVKKTV
jgi:hypothetical protein